MTKDKDMLEDLMQADALCWAGKKSLRLSDGVRFDMVGRDYLVGLVGCNKRVMSVKKGSQVCITTAKFIEAVHRCYYKYYTKNIIYMLPTVKQAELLSKVAFDPIFDYNPWLKKCVNTNNASLKTINGRSIVFVGAQSKSVGDSSTKDSVNLRSIAGDAVYRDEIDMMDPDMVFLSKQRLNASKFRIECNFGSPTIPEFGIDQLFNDGDQRKWQIKCSHCGKYTCLVEDFPNTILKIGGKWLRACIHCHKEIYVQDGDWIAEYPNRREASFWVDGLITPMADLEEYMLRYHNSDGTKLSEFERSILGRAADEATSQITKSDVLERCSMSGLKSFSDSPTCMGVDTGDDLHYVIGQKTGSGSYRLLSVGHTTEFGDLYDIARKMKVKFSVFDKGPDIHAVKEFQRSAGHIVYRCLYNEQAMAAPNFDRKKGVVKCNRNEISDRVRSAFVDERISIPRDCTEIRNYAEQLTKMRKFTQFHPDTGLPKTSWNKIGNKQDHYFHATNYFLLAASQVSPVRGGSKSSVIKVKNNHYL